VNTSGSPVTFDVQLKDGAGALFKEMQQTLPPGNQMALFVDQLFGHLPDGFQGLMIINSGATEGIVAFGITISQGIMTSIPTMHYGSISGGMSMMP